MIHLPAPLGNRGRSNRNGSGTRRRSNERPSWRKQAFRGTMFGEALIVKGPNAVKAKQGAAMTKLRFGLTRDENEVCPGENRIFLSVASSGCFSGGKEFVQVLKKASGDLLLASRSVGVGLDSVVIDERTAMVLEEFCRVCLGAKESGARSTLHVSWELSISGEDSVFGRSSDPFHLAGKMCSAIVSYARGGAKELKGQVLASFLEAETRIEKVVLDTSVSRPSGRAAGPSTP